MSSTFFWLRSGPLSLKNRKRRHIYTASIIRVYTIYPLYQIRLKPGEPEGSIAAAAEVGSRRMPLYSFAYTCQHIMILRVRTSGFPIFEKWYHKLRKPALRKMEHFYAAISGEIGSKLF